LSQHSKELIFGLGDVRGPLNATIQWPSGTVQRLQNLRANHRIRVEEGADTPILEPFRTTAATQPPSGPQTAEALPSNAETWLLTPVPVPIPEFSPGRLTLLTLAAGGAEQTDKVAIFNLLFRNLFDRRRDITLPTSFLTNQAGEIVKVYQGPVSAQQVESDIARIPQTPEQRLALALPYRGNAETYAFGRNHLSLGSIYFQRGYLDPAETFFRLALRDDPSSAEAHYGLGSVNLQRNNTKNARASFEQAVRLNASYTDTGPNAWNNLGLLATREGRLDEAIRCFQEALHLSPDYWIALENAGNAYRQQGRSEEARAALERVVALRPRDPAASYSLAMVFAQADDPERAEEYLQKALALQPNYPEALNNLGIVYLRTHRRDEAVAKFEESIHIAPAFDQAYLNLARVYALEGSKDRARDVLDDLLRQHPGHPQAQQMLEGLK
jgi:tetratricopeptide (TPR) repeat protein